MAVATSCLRLVSRARLHLGDSASLKKPASRSPFANSTARPVPGTAGSGSAPRLLSDREHLLAAARCLLHGHHAGVVGDDAHAADVDERVRGAEVDCEVP